MSFWSEDSRTNHLKYLMGRNKIWNELVERLGVKGACVAFLEGRLTPDEELILIESVSPEIIKAVAMVGSGAATKRVADLGKICE